MVDFIDLTLNKISNYSSNEFLNNFTLDRNFIKLYENDLKNLKFLESLIFLKNQILKFYPGKSYKVGQYIWYYYEDEKDETKNIFLLLQNIFEDNQNEPFSEEKDIQNLNFEKSGWVIKSGINSVFQKDFDEFCKKYVSTKLFNEHEKNKNYHKFGELTSVNELKSKVLLRSFLNINHDRKNNFFPYETVKLYSDNVIQNGFYRRWENGFIEYNIIFKLGSNKKYIFNNDFNRINCNNLEINPEIDSKYFLNINDLTIFNQKNSINNNKNIKLQSFENLNNKLECISGIIKFPIPFKNTNYMLFTSNSKNNSSNNCLIFCNKTIFEITPIYLFKINKDENLNFSNIFQCQIIGKWK